MTLLSLIELKQAVIELEEEIRINKNRNMCWCSDCQTISDDDFCEVCSR